MNSKINITICIADQPRISLSIPPDQEERVRKAEAAANGLYRKWKAKFKDKSSPEVMAMVLYRFAQLWLESQEQARETEKLLGDFENDLDRLLIAPVTDHS